MPSNTSKQTFAAIQQSMNSLIKLFNQRWNERWQKVDKLIEVLWEDPDLIGLKKGTGTKLTFQEWEKGIAGGIDVLSLSDNVEFGVAIDDYCRALMNYKFKTREEDKEKELNELNEYRLIVLNIFRLQLARALGIYEKTNMLAEETSLKFISKSNAILEEARMIEHVKKNLNDWERE